MLCYEYYDDSKMVCNMRQNHQIRFSLFFFSAHSLAPVSLFAFVCFGGAIAVAVVVVSFGSNFNLELYVYDVKLTAFTLKS